MYRPESQLQWNFFLMKVIWKSYLIFNILKCVERGEPENQCLKLGVEVPCHLVIAWLSCMSSPQCVHRNVNVQLNSWMVVYLITYVHKYSTKTLFTHHFSLMLNTCWEFWNSNSSRSYLWFCSYTCSLETYKVITRLFFLSLFFAVNNSVLLFFFPTDSPSPAFCQAIGCKIVIQTSSQASAVW
jgi:hypothetical protein